MAYSGTITSRGVCFRPKPPEYRARRLKNASHDSNLSVALVDILLVDAHHVDPDMSTDRPTNHSSQLRSSWLGEEMLLATKLMKGVNEVCCHRDHLAVADGPASSLGVPFDFFVGGDWMLRANVSTSI
jgi:hypothetical protein